MAQEKILEYDEELSDEEIIKSKHSLYAELGGRTFIFGSVNYEFALLEKLSIGVGLGVIGFYSGEISRNNNGSSEDGRYLDTSTSQMIYANYFFGKDKNKLLLTAGLTNFLATSRNTYPSETERFSDSFVRWNAGLGYQFTKKRKYFRITAYLLSLTEDSDFFPDYLPWLGLSFGFRIK